MRRLACLLPLLLSVTWASAQQVPPLAPSALEPAGTGGLRVVDRALAKLTNHRRLLVVGAHPDDEDTTLLTYVARALGGEAAYLSLTRGEGGQNLIGPELGVGLGLIRTGELMSARELEGTRQYFTRAFDFGYTRSLDETFERWPQQVLEQDAVRIVRRFKPQVIVTIFSPDASSGHGQHQAAGVIAEAMFRLSGAPDRYPDLTAAGLEPWQPTALYRRLWRRGSESSIEFPLDEIDPSSGHSMLQLAAASRSLHRSQDMGTLQQIGRVEGGLVWLAGKAVKDDRVLFGGVDTGLAAIADLLEPGPLRDRARQQLEVLANGALETRQRLGPVTLGEAVPMLESSVRTLRALEEEVLTAVDQPARRIVRDLLSEKRQVAVIGLLAAAGVVVDAIAERQVVAPGDSLPVEVSVWDSSRIGLAVESIDLITPEGWAVEILDRVTEAAAVSGLETRRFELQVPSDARATVPYYLYEPLNGDLYGWQAVDASILGEPFAKGPVVAVLELEIEGVAARIEREVVFRERDQALGEVRRPLRVVPELEVRMRPELLLWPRQSKPTRVIEVLLRSHSKEPLSGSLHFVSEQDWPLPDPVSFAIDAPDGQQVLRVSVEEPAIPPTGRVEITALAELTDGRQFQTAFPVVRYPHIRSRAMPVPATTELESFELELPEIDEIGYLRGASDRVPEVLIELGLRVQLLSAAELATSDLARFDVIVIGSRAYETEPALAQSNGRLLEYVRDGGCLLVQYQQYDFVAGRFAPYELEIARPHGRVVDETAPVEMLDDSFGAFSYPNQIVTRDWSGWVQERGLYFASAWDPRFQPLLAIRDPGRRAEKGSLLIAPVGEGLYVYTGLSFFRQLPAGVPGAIRLFVNLLAMGRT